MALDPEKQIALAEKLTVEPGLPNESMGAQFSGDWLSGYFRPTDLLPPWGNRQRDIYLRRYSYATHNTLVQGTIAGVVKKIASTPWEISGGGKILTKKWQRIFQDSQLGDGWTDFLSRFLWDFLTQDFGGVGEIIGYGDPSRPLPTARPVVGIRALDSLSCIATGNTEFPIIYYSRGVDNKPSFHRLHRTRCFRFVDMPSPDKWALGNGFCALSRALSVMNMQMLIGKYGNEKLNDLPPAGLLKLGNVKPGEWDGWLRSYKADNQADGAQVYKNFMRIESSDPTHPIEIEFVPFAQVPDGFNYAEYMDIHVNMLALAFGIDRQEIWELGGGQLGTGTQSQMLNAKARGKLYGYILSGIERLWNRHILPEEIEFKFQFQDDEQDATEAEIAARWADVLSKIESKISTEQYLQLLANRVPAFKDVLIDADGNVRLPDDDPKTDEQTDIIGDDITTLTPEVEQPEGEEPPVEGEPEDEETQPVQPMADDEEDEDEEEEKSIQATRLDFESDFAEAVAAAKDDEMTRRRFGVVLRALISKYGRKAYEDGLSDGGVDVSEEGLSSDDLSSIAGIVADQSAYVTSFANTIWEGTDYTPEARAALWYNKSITPFYQAGQTSADQNGLYEWAYGDTEHCNDCLRLNGQSHRLKEWVSRDLFPPTSSTECGGWNCQCKLNKTSGRARGRY